MGLLDKVLSKPSGEAKGGAAQSGSTPAPTSVSSMLSSPGAPPPEPLRAPQSPVVSDKKLGETDADEQLPDSMIPFSQRIVRKIQAKLKSDSKGKAPSSVKGKSKVGKKEPGHKHKPIVGGKRILSVDIGTSSIKVIELHKQGINYSIKGLESRAIPLAMRKNPDSLLLLQGKLLREMLPATRIKNADIHLTISDKSAQARMVTIPGGAAKELVNAIKFQIKKDLPFPLDVCDISYRGYNEKSPGKQDIEILAVDRRAVESSLQLLTEIDALPVVITAPSASSRFLVKDYTGIEAGAGAVVVIDIGASHTTITIVEENNVVLSRTVATGGDDFTSALSGVALGPNGEELTDLQAEKYKIDVGLPSERDSGGMIKAAIQMRPIAERISTEINRSLEFFRRARTGGEIKKIIMAGGGSLMKRLPEFISENTGVDIVMGIPTARVNLAGGASEALEAQSTEFGPIFISALAVALDDGKELNLLPKSVQASLNLRKAQGWIAPAAVGLMVLLIAAYVIALGARRSAESEMANIQNQLKDLDKSRAQFVEATASYENLLEQLKARQVDYDSIRMGEPEIPRYLKAFSNLTPENVYLNKMATKFLNEVDLPEEEAKSSEEQPAISMENIMSSFTKSFGDPLSAANLEKNQAPPVKRPVFGRVIELEGVIYPQGTMTDVQLVDYVFNLENSGHFRDVAVDSMTTTEDGRVKFRIICGM